MEYLKSFVLMICVSTIVFSSDDEISGFSDGQDSFSEKETPRAMVRKKIPTAFSSSEKAVASSRAALSTIEVAENQLDDMITILTGDQKKEITRIRHLLGANRTEAVDALKTYLLSSTNVWCVAEIRNQISEVLITLGETANTESDGDDSGSARMSEDA